MKKIFNKSLLILFVSFSLSSCDTSTTQTMKSAPIIVWTTQAEKEIIEDVVAKWNGSHVKNQQFNVTYEILDENEVAFKILNEQLDKNDIPSLFLTSNRYLPDLVNNNKIKETKGDKKNTLLSELSNNVINYSMFDNKLYGYPISGINNTLLWYNNQYFEEENIKSLEEILSIAKDNSKKVYFDITDGYYLSSIFMSPSACGIDSMEYNISEKSNDKELFKSITYETTWDNQKGVEVATYISSLLSRYYNENVLLIGEDIDLVGRIKNNEIIAAITESTLLHELKNQNNIEVTNLPSYEIDDKMYQMTSFSSINTYYINKDVNAVKQVSAETLTNLIVQLDVQLDRYQLSDIIPSNKVALQDNLFSNNLPKTYLALENQYKYSKPAYDIVESRYYAISNIIGNALIENNFDGKTIQDFLKTQLDILRNTDELNDN